MACSDEELVLFATSIAIELSRGLTQDEISDLRNLVNQISCSLSTLIGLKNVSNKKNSQNKDISNNTPLTNNSQNK